MGDENDSYSEVTTESWGSRLMGSIKGVGIGFLLILASVILLWWNEGRSVKTYKSLKEGKGLTVEAKADSVNASLENKLVHVSGHVTTDETLVDPVFYVSAAKALSFRRTVEMYQWQEHCTSESEKNLGGSKTTTTKCTYDKAWADSIDSSKFKKPKGHQNPEMLYKSMSRVTKSAKLGAYRLPQDLTSSLSNYTALDIDDTVVRAAKAVTGKPATKTSDGIFLGLNPDKPALGDYRVKFEVVRPTDASVIAKQTSDTFSAYQTEAGGTISMISEGIVSAKDMFTSAEKANATITWILRLVGWLAMTVGFSMLLKPFVTLLDVVPFLGSIMGFGVGLASGVTAFAISLLTIALAWLFYRPILSLILFAIAAAIVYFFKMRGAKKKAEAV